jgi:hypothetical protein
LSTPRASLQHTLHVRRPRQALSSDGSTLYVGGKFDGAGDADARNLAAWDTGAQSWRPVCGAVGVSEVSPTDRSEMTNFRTHSGGVHSSLGLRCACTGRPAAPHRKDAQHAAKPSCA